MHPTPTTWDWGLRQLVGLPPFNSMFADRVSGPARFGARAARSHPLNSRGDGSTKSKTTAWTRASKHDRQRLGQWIYLEMNAQIGSLGFGRFSRIIRLRGVTTHCHNRSRERISRMGEIIKDVKITEFISRVLTWSDTKRKRKIRRRSKQTKEKGGWNWCIEFLKRSIWTK